MKFTLRRSMLKSLSMLAFGAMTLIAQSTTYTYTGNVYSTATLTIAS